MVNGFMETIRNIGVGITPVVVGLVLANNKALIPFLPEVVHLWGGWAIAVVGVVDLFQRFSK